MSLKIAYRTLGPSQKTPSTNGNGTIRGLAFYDVDEIYECLDVLHAPIFEFCDFELINLRYQNLRPRVGLKDIVIRDCDFTACDFFRISWTHPVYFYRSSFTDCDFTDAKWGYRYSEDCLFTNCGPAHEPMPLQWSVLYPPQKGCLWNGHSCDVWGSAVQAVAKPLTPVAVPAKVIPDHCPKCNLIGTFVRMSLVCPIHGPYAGI